MTPCGSSHNVHCQGVNSRYLIQRHPSALLGLSAASNLLGLLASLSRTS